MTRGIRLNNPGLIRHGDKWQGLAIEQPDAEFCKFEEPRWGIRAIARLLIKYQDKHGINTVRGVISRWAPASENNTASYIRHVCQLTGMAADDPLDLHSFADAEPLVRAIIHHENGQQPYGDAVINDSLKLAGIEPPAKPIAASRTVQGGTGAAVGGAAITVDSVVEIARGAAVLDLGGIVQVAIGLAIVGFAAYTIYARWDDRRNGRG